MTDNLDCDVLIVGAGPVGVTLALLLAKQGLSVLAADRAADIYPLPRAAHIDHEIVRVFQSLGVADAIMASSKPAARYDFLTAGGEVLLRFNTGEGGSPSGWPAANMIHQPSLEATLRERLADFPTARLRTEWTLTCLDQDEQGVQASFETPEGPQVLRAAYVVGCDGARSTVRELSGIDLDDLAFDEPWLVIDTIVHAPSRLPALNLQICDPARPTTCVQMGSGRHRWEFMLKPGETAEDVLDDGFIAALLKPWNVEGAVSLERKAVYRFHALVAREWRKGRVLLAGDAAHQMPPFAGQGLCSGVRDAANLAWKLAEVLRGRAPEALLDTYQAEREPHVRAIIDLALMMGRTVCITDPAAAAARDAAMLAQRAAGDAPPGPMAFPPLSAGCIVEGTPGAGEYFPQPWAEGAGGQAKLDDVLGDGAWLISIDAVDPILTDGLAAWRLSNPALQPYAEAIRAWLAKREMEAVLIRPDRYVFGAGSAAGLAAGWAALIGS
ncbi:bifunctional 3-(3-hydroxy-phenyl)propionate/3-hydroxycinnamic acid hydroxylase MhpA [Phenylobacterium montanum]|uniref:Bifunctional 3-(3-hydroxy-phenyl)propionate/3-hydroxycinnamic acid hydroxylase n=1 Tax=Phenylobacterium montanum TaxID=2823693 RepID=A0A975IUM4_9CAUL|nr:bifunctional 3-(3-hydroxy-phenyl)propionate/3-hydroxycinnamic acid hydroxylase [Caulobacter sp. S6]QUD88112.1 bifunctional 3-(3-hydroxy-phenyl)propionate/3-hydroxycinnamic acid hydroxylase [Caulobacter sp. S6]